MHNVQLFFCSLIRYISRLPSILVTYYVKHPLSWPGIAPVIFVAITGAISVLLHLHELHMAYLLLLPFFLLPMSLTHTENIANVTAWLSVLVSIIGTSLLLLLNQQELLHSYSRLADSNPHLFTGVKVIAENYSEDLTKLLTFALPFIGMGLFFTKLTTYFSYAPYSEWNNWSINDLKLERYRYIGFALSSVLYLAFFSAIFVSPLFGISIPPVANNLLLWSACIVVVLLNIIPFLVCIPSATYSYKRRVKNKVAVALGRRLLIRTHPSISFESLKSQSTESNINTMFNNIRHVFQQDNLDHLDFISCVLSEYAKKLTSFFQNIALLRSDEEQKETDNMCHHNFFALGIAVAHLSHDESFATHRLKNWRIRKMVDSIFVEEKYHLSLQYGYAIGEVYQILKNENVSTQQSFQQLLSESEEYIATILAKSPRVNYPEIVAEMNRLNKSAAATPTVSIASSPVNLHEPDLIKTILAELVEHY